MAPLSDTHDEFIELFNPTADTINLAGYTLRTGSKFHDYYVLPSLVLGSGGYIALYSSQTKLSLVNTGGAAEILDPNGAVEDVTPAYGAAPEGQSWARFDDGWHWTLQQTPGQPNILAVSVTLATPAKAKAAVRTKAPKATRVKKPKATAKLQPQLAAAHNLQPATWLLIGLATLTIGYALYEFRYDLYNLYYRLRGYPAPRPENRPPATRRDHD